MQFARPSLNVCRNSRAMQHQILFPAQSLTERRGNFEPCREVSTTATQARKSAGFLIFAPHAYGPNFIRTAILRTILDSNEFAGPTSLLPTDRVDAAIPAAGRRRAKFEPDNGSGKACAPFR